MIYILGGRGFVGSALVRLFENMQVEHRSISRENFGQYSGSSCDILINANGNSKKYLAAREPMTDFDQSVRSVAESLEAFKFEKYVFLSTGDVYPEQHTPCLTLETDSIDTTRQSRYGLHKYIAEQLVCGIAPRWLVFRMGGFIGPGLKKNAIYDMLKAKPVWLSPESELQFISTDGAARLIWSLVERDVRNEIVNLGAEGVVSLRTVYQMIGSKSVFQPDAPTIRYELSLDKLNRLAATPPPRSQEEIQAFIQAVKRQDIELQ